MVVPTKSNWSDFGARCFLDSRARMRRVDAREVFKMHVLPVRLQGQVQDTLARGGLSELC